MSIRTFDRRLAPVVAAAALAGLAGCGDDDTPSPEDVQQQLEEAEGKAGEAAEGAKEQLQQGIDEAEEQGGQAEGKAKEALEDLLRQTEEGE
jgi:hypothetical protein